MNAVAVKALTHAVREDMEGIVASMPHKIRSPRQRALAKLHGTPREFARKVIMAIGEITHDEATAAMSRYFKQWEDAK